MPSNNDLSPQELDLLARTVIGEAGNQPLVGQAAVAHTILNRLNSGQWGNTIPNVVLAPKQFEAWSVRPQELATIPRTSKQYQDALIIAKHAANGDIPDPTNGALNFANVDEVKRRGNQSAMGWINGMTNVTKIGDHTFGNAKGQKMAQKPQESSDDILQQYLKPGVEVPKDTATSTTAPTADTNPEDIVNMYLKEPAKAAQVDTRTASDKLLGVGAQRYQTWPERLVRGLSSSIASGLTLPGDVAQGKTPVPFAPNMSQEVPNGANRLLDLAGVIGTGSIPNALDRSPVINPEVANLAKMARDKYGIPIRGGQISNSPTVRWMDAVMQNKPFSGYAENSANQQTAFNRAIAQQMGEDAPNLSRPVLRSAKKRLGQEYEDIADATGKMTPDDQLHQGLMNVYRDAVTNIPDKADAIKNKILKIGNSVDDNGAISGETFKGLIRKNGPVDPGLHKSDGSLGYYTGQLRGVLNDFLSRQAPPEVADRLATANKQYSIMKMVDPIAKKSPSGDVSPALLMSKVPDKGDIYDLAMIGQMMKPLQSSGTSERLSAAQKLMALGGLGGLEGGMAWVDPMLALKVGAGAAAAMTGKGAINAGVGSALRSDWYANSLINRSLPGRTLSPIEKLTNAAIPYNPPPVGLLPGQKRIDLPDAPYPGYYTAPE